MASSSIANVVPLPAVEETRSEQFAHFLEQQRRPLLAFLRRRTASEADAEDAVQESMARLLRYRDRQSPQAWKPLLYRIAANTANDQSRQRHRHRHDVHRPIDEMTAVLATTQPSHEQRVDQERELAAIRELILQLPARCRQVYLLNRIEGLSYRETAHHCGISVKAVEKHIAKALKALRQGLGERGLRA